MKTDSSNTDDRKWHRRPVQGNYCSERPSPGHRSDNDKRLPQEFQIISLKSVADLLDTTRSSARRWLKEAGIKPIALGKGAKGAIRYRWQDVEEYLKSREYVD